MFELHFAGRPFPDDHPRGLSRGASRSSTTPAGPIPSPRRSRFATEVGSDGIGLHACEARLAREAELELLRVHRQELSRLLLLAAGIRAARDEREIPLAAFPAARISTGAWGGRARIALRLCALDDLELPAVHLLRSLQRGSPASWPEVDELTRAALRCEEDAFARICHGHALLRRGRLALAEAWFRELLDRDPPPHLGWRVLEGLAAAHAAAGRHRLAMGAMEAAADVPVCGIGPLASGLYLALRAGDLRRSQRAAARLDLLVDPTEPRFEAAVRRIQAYARTGDSRRLAPRRLAPLRSVLEPEGRSPAEKLFHALV